MVELSTWYARSEVAVCTSGACSVTSIIWLALANSSCRFKGMVWLASTTIPEILTVAKLAALTSTVYVPGGTSEKRYEPSLPVVVL